MILYNRTIDFRIPLAAKESRHQSKAGGGQQGVDTVGGRAAVLFSR